MTQARRIKPISYLKANAAQIVRELAEEREPIIITQNGEAKAAILDIDSFEQTQETLALLKILALGNRRIEQGRVTPVANVVDRLRPYSSRLDASTRTSASEAREQDPPRKSSGSTRTRKRRGPVKR